MTQFITKNKKVIPISQSTSDNDLIKFIKDGSKNWNDWGRNGRTEDAYAEIERRNRLVPLPKFTKVGTVFRDDPNAIEKMKDKVKNFENEQEYWKKITKFPNRDYQNHRQLGDEKFFALTGASTNLREAKKKLDKLESDKKEGVKLSRETTFINGKKRFFFKEHKDDEK